MTGTIVVVGVLLLALAWFFWPIGDAAPDIDPGRRPGVDVAELEQAERDAREAVDQDSVREWGPGGPGSGMQKPLL